MTTKQAYKLTMHPVARTHGAELRPSDPVFLYEVEGLPNKEHVQILNTRAQGREPSWQTRYVAIDTYTGDYKTAEVALAVLEKAVNGQ